MFCQGIIVQMTVFDVKLVIGFLQVEPDSMFEIVDVDQLYMELVMQLLNILQLVAR